MTIRVSIHFEQVQYQIGFDLRLTCIYVVEDSLGIRSYLNLVWCFGGYKGLFQCVAMSRNVRGELVTYRFVGS